MDPGDRYIANQLAALKKKPVIALVTKTDLVDRAALAKQLMSVTALGNEVLGEAGWADVVPVSAADGFQVDTVADVLASAHARLPAAVPGR